ncbi:peptide MFS transporter [uncultured Alistipes sp.]|uniref:peptide MFS transporter n=1 Tax=uncultured Alistipes sp. TaxID=538949 RepID=UPI002639A5EE|nr:peptide MFS transporter [uncultured Alistipes sp.]
MFKGQPKGLYALALANTGERFGYYTMLAIFTLFLQAKFGFTATVTSNIFAGFLALVYFLPVLGGYLADKFGYGKMVTSGIIVMFIGYMCLAIPTGNDAGGIVAMVGALVLIALGTGLFKGNLQVMVGNLYDDPKYSAKRDTAFSIFYMAINIGALFAPTAAEKITEWYMGKAGFSYNGDIPALAHQYLEGTLSGDALAKFTDLAAAQGAQYADNLTAFSNDYINCLSGSYHWGFAVACVSLIVSMLIYVFGRKTFKHADVTAKQVAAKSAQNHEPATELTPAQTKSRVVALLLVFAVVIFFWMAFHQNGLTLTFFARDYTATSASGLTRIGFDVVNLVLIIVAVYALFSTFQSEKGRSKLISFLVAIAALGLLVWKYQSMGDASIAILPQKFQQFNPFFVVALTPVSMAVFGMLAKKGKEPSAPRKIGIGMVIAAVGFLIMAIGSLGLPIPNDLASTTTDYRVTPNLLISTYLVLTFAELFLSPMGISFVSKVAPPKYKGMMMGLWFAATAVGNYLVAVIGMLWGGLPLWVLWGILIALCLLSALFIFSIMKKLESVTNNA